jgi:hypothetical protein
LELKTSTVHRKLDRKLKIAGLEAPDLLAVLMFGAIMNLIFGQTALALPIVIILPSVMLLVLYFGKRDKPDGYLLHLLRFYFTPGFYSAGEDPKHEHLMRRNIIDTKPRK